MIVRFAQTLTDIFLGWHNPWISIHLSTCGMNLNAALVEAILWPTSLTQMQFVHLQASCGAVTAAKYGQTWWQGRDPKKKKSV